MSMKLVSEPIPLNLNISFNNRQFDAYMMDIRRQVTARVLETLPDTAHLIEAVNLLYEILPGGSCEILNIPENTELRIRRLLDEICGPAKNEAPEITLATIVSAYTNLLKEKEQLIQQSNTYNTNNDDVPAPSLEVTDATEATESNPWYPDDSGLWVEYQGQGIPVSSGIKVQILVRDDRVRREHVGTWSRPASHVNWSWINCLSGRRVVAYKVIGE